MTPSAADKPIVPLWLKLSYTTMVCVIVPIYWHVNGPSNFLWFSDIGLLTMVPALWLRSRFLSSMMAVGVLPLEIPWMISFFSGGRLLNMAKYMFDPIMPMYMRALSLFHFPMPACILFMLFGFGYDRRALYPQMLVGAVVLLLTRRYSSVHDNINMVFPPAFLAQYVSLNAYLIIEITALVFVIMPLTHGILNMFVRRYHHSPVRSADCG